MGTQPPTPPPKRGHSPSLFDRVYCGQTAGWIKMPFGTELGLDPAGHIVLDEDPAPPKGAQPPTFGRCLLWPNGRPSQLLLSTYCLSTLLWPPYIAAAGIIFLSCGFFFFFFFFFTSIFFPRLISAVAYWMSTIHVVRP